MSEITLPKDAEGREIPLDTKVLYDEDGRELEVDRFTYLVTQSMAELKWGFVLKDCRANYCSSFYLTPPDSWEKLEKDLGNGADGATPFCSYAGNEICACSKCRFGSARKCTRRIFTDIRDRVRKLRSDGE